MIFLAYAFNSNAMFKGEKYLFQYEDCEFVFYPGGEKYCDVVQTLVNDGEKDRAFELMYKFLLAFGWANGVQFKFESGFTSSHPLVDLFEMPRRMEVRRKYFDVRPFLYLAKVTTEQQQFALSLYNDALISGDAFYQFFCYWKILGIRNPGEQEGYITQWIDQTYMSEKFEIHPKFLDWVKESRMTLGHYLKDFGRHAIAHVERKNAVFSFRASDRERIAYANRAIEAFVIYFMEEVLELRKDSEGVQVLKTMPESSL